MKSMISTGHRKKIAIITSFFEKETYGLLGPQMAATIIRDNTSFDSMVIGVSREDDFSNLKKRLYEFTGYEKPIIGFSLLSGRQDLFDLAGELKDEGATTILAGPQANVDFIGEVECEKYPHRFKGVSDQFTYACHGPAEQFVSFLRQLKNGDHLYCPGLLYKNVHNVITEVPSKKWEDEYLKSVNWNNIYRLKNHSIVPFHISSGQILQQIGCPHASAKRLIQIDPPSTLKMIDKISLKMKGCGFCDVAKDKGFHGSLDIETVLEQIKALPMNPDSRKIPFELINENPLPGLPKLLDCIIINDIKISQINLTLRADWLIKGEKFLIESLKIGRRHKIKIVLTSIGFESYDDRILRNFNKGLDVKTNLKAIQFMRQLKADFPDEFGYLRQEGGNHGFIHPTPWDTAETESNINSTIDRHGLAGDILPDHSIPLIIHHASALGDWIRTIEEKENILFPRYGSTIGWWEHKKTLRNKTE